MTAVVVACPVVPSLDPAPHELAALRETGMGGLVALATGLPLPLAAVRVRATIVGACARTVVEQRFTNVLSTPIEAAHIFPLPPAGAVVELTLHAGDTTVVAECRERGEAERIFDTARDEGHRAALLTMERADVHTLRVTRIPPGAEVRVRIVVVQPLEAIDGRFVWRFPTVVAPRYHSGAPIGHDGLGVHPDTDHVPDASRISPPLRLAGGTTLDLQVELAGAVSEVCASSHAVAMRFEDQVVRVAPSVRATLDRDFVVAFTWAQADAPSVRAFTDGVATLVVASAPMGQTAQPVPRDAVFVVDISGSMGGSKMVAAKAALTTALHGLLPGDRFRLIAFDDRLEVFRSDFVDYADATLAAADAWIAGLDARGGTEMLPAIQAALAGATPPGRMRTVLFITDGQASNEQALVAAVAHRRNGARFFTLGIDTAVNEALLTRLARVGGGVCELASPQDDLELTVARIEARFGMPVIDAVVAHGGEAARPEPAAVYAGRPAALWLAGAPDTVRVSGQLASGAFEAQVAPERVSAPIATLWARERVGYLEDRITLNPVEDEALRPQILRLGLEHSIVTRWTAFVAVERGEHVPGDHVQAIVQPVEAPASWDMSGGGAPMVAGLVMTAFARSPKRARAPAPVAARSPMPAPAPAPAPARGIVGGLFDAARSLFRAERDEDTVFHEEMSFDGDMAPAAPSGTTPAEVAAHLARTQSADGSFGGDARRTASALLTLVLQGNTRRAGPRSRVVLKAAAWLAAHRTDPVVAAALDALDSAERGETPQVTPEWAELRPARE